MTMKIEELSRKYSVKKMDFEDGDQVYELCSGNPAYYEYAKSSLDREEILEDLLWALPPGKGHEDKYFVGFYREEKLAAVMDLIADFPREGTALLGFFMIAGDLQRKGIGTEIVEEVMAGLKDAGFSRCRLGYIKENTPAKAFWEKNLFLPTGEEKDTESYKIIVMEREL